MASSLAAEGSAVVVASSSLDASVGLTVSATLAGSFESAETTSWYQVLKSIPVKEKKKERPCGQTNKMCACLKGCCICMLVKLEATIEELTCLEIGSDGEPFNCTWLSTQLSLEETRIMFPRTCACLNKTESYTLSHLLACSSTFLP